MKLQIESLSGFLNFIKSVKSIAPGAILVVTNKGCIVKSRNESHSVRAYFRTNVIKAICKDDESSTLPILDLTKFLQAIKMVIETNQDEDKAELNITKQFITYNGKCKFRLKLYMEAHLAFHTTEAIKAQTDDIFSFKVSADMFKYSLKYKAITGEKDPKIYIYVKDNVVLAEHDDKTKALVDSVGVNISDEFTGDLQNPICININNNYSKFNPLGADEIEVALQSKPFVKVRSVINTGTYVAAVEIVSKILEK